MVEKKSEFGDRLDLIRYAYGFADHEYHRRGESKGQIDPASGKFFDIFVREMYEAWTEDMPQPAGFPDDDFMKAPPGKNNNKLDTQKRWFRSERTPKRKQLPGIAETLQVILAKARETETHKYLTDAGAKNPCVIPRVFNFKWEHLSENHVKLRELARDLGTAIEAYDTWKETTRPVLAEDAYDPKLLLYRGYYYAYRIHADIENCLQRNPVVIRESKSSSTFEMYMFTKDDEPWRGEIVKGLNTLSILLQRDGGLEGKHVNPLSLVYDDLVPDLLYGFRSRILYKNPRHIASYRIVLVKQPNPKFLDFVAGDFTDKNLVREIGLESKPLSTNPADHDALTRHVLESLLSEQDDAIDGVSIYANNGYNLCSVYKPLRDSVIEESKTRAEKESPDNDELDVANG